MAYEHFYQFYDSLMDDVPYEKYIDLVKKFAKKEQLILDIGCGTGSVLIELLKFGFIVDGLDISDEMLLLTSQKLYDNNLHAELYQDDMLNIEIKNYYDIIYSFLDSINYLTSLVEVKKTFQNVYNALKEKGTFLFDVHSLYKVFNIFDGYCYNETNEFVTYLWNTYVEKTAQYSTVYHELSFFMKQQSGLYKRLDEYHEQVVFPLETYLTILKEVGFKIDDILFDFDLSKNENNCEKILIIAKK